MKKDKRLSKQEKADKIAEILKKMYPEIPIPLEHKDKYTLLIAVLLSAQCTDKRVNQITPLLFAKADTPQKMIQLTVDEIREIIKPCGLSPRKSKAIYGLSHILLDKHNGEVPESFEALEALPGVGHKTASVVMSQGFGHPAFPVDTHIHRLAYRWTLSTGKNVVSQKTLGMTYIYKLFISVENIVRHEDMTLCNAQYVVCMGERVCLNEYFATMNDTNY